MSGVRDVAITQEIGREYTGSTVSPKLATLMVRKETLVGGGGHYGYPDFPSNRDVGGDFQLNTYRFDTSPSSVGRIWRGGPLSQYYIGAVCPTDDFYGGQVPGNRATVDDTMGSLAYNRMKPTRPSMAGFAALYEGIKDTPALLRQRFLKQGLHAIPNYWLALQFGWKPLLSDIRNCILVQLDAQKRLNQLIRDNGKVVRRKFVIYDTTRDEDNRTTHVIQNVAPGLVTQYYTGDNVNQTSFWGYDRAWASAAFRYYLPDGPQDINWTIAMKARIFGLYPSPSAVWQVLPWSWLIDWFANVGNMLENMEAGVANELYNQYFYVMRQVGEVYTKQTTTHFQRENGDPVVVAGSSRSEWAHKARYAGNPFGWSTSSAPLNAYQASILGALGLSRVGGRRG